MSASTPAPSSTTSSNEAILQIFTPTAKAPSHLETILPSILSACNATTTSTLLPLSLHITETTVTFPSPISLSACHALRLSPAIQQIEADRHIQILIQPRSLYNLHRLPGLAVFDMDSTLIQQEIIDELARSIGRYDAVAAITEAAMRGDLNFGESLRARVKLLEGVETGVWEVLKRDVVTFTPGAKDLVRFLRLRGWKTAVLSGGFMPLATWVKTELGLDFALANELAVDEGRGVLTGELKEGAEIVGAEKKREVLLRLAREWKIEVARTVAVGDGSNDLLMMGAAGLGVAWCAKPKVQAAAAARVNGGSLLDVAHVLGYTEEEVRETLKEDGGVNA